MVSTLGRALVIEMNRLGMLVDISHTSDATALEAISVSRAPVMWSHSSARTLRDIPRNVPDSVLEKIGEESEGKKDGIIMVPLFPFFPLISFEWTLDLLMTRFSGQLLSGFCA